MSNISDKPWLVPGHMYQYDIGWLVDKLLSFETELNTAIDLKTIHYADPIQWDITTQYAPNTVVVDPKTGTAYMSKVPVPAGILLTNTDYWVVIFNYQRIYNKIMAGVAYNEEDNLYASKDFAINDLVWYGGDLYRCIKEIAEGGKFVVDANITPTTIESLLDNYYGKNRTAHVTSDTITADGDIAESAANKNVTVTGGITESAENKNVTVTGGITESAANKLINADTMTLNLINPLRYRKPTEKDDNFNAIQMADPDGNIYDVLVYKRHIDGYTNTKIGYNGSVMSDLETGCYYAQGGTYLNGYYYQLLRNGAESKQVIYKINESTGAYTYKSFDNLYHGNSMATDGTYLYVLAWGFQATAPYKIYKMSADLNVLNTYSIDIAVLAICYDKATNKWYAIDDSKIYEISLSNTVTYTEIGNINGYYTSYKIQGCCVNDGTMYIAYSNPESILKIDVDGGNPKFILLDNYINDLFPVGELEDLEYIDGRLYTFSTVRTDMAINQLNPALLIFGNLGVSNDTIFASFDGTRNTVYVGDNTSFKCVGTKTNQFADTQQAVIACQVAHKLFGIEFKIEVDPISRIYNGFYVQGAGVKQITHSSGRPTVRYIRTKGACVTIDNFNVSSKIDDTENILIDNSLVCLNNIDPINIDALSGRCFISGDSSFVSIIGVMSSTQNDAYNAGKVVYAGLTGFFRAYPKTTMYMHNSGAPNAALGVEVARSVAVTTTATKIAWNRIMPKDVSLSKYAVFLFVIGGVGYTVCGSCKIQIATDNTLTISYSNGRFTLSATKNVTVDSIFAIR